MIEVFGAKAPFPALKGVIRENRPVWCLEELKVPYKMTVLDPKKQENKTPEYLSINPFGKIPSIRDGDFSLFESAAICTYLGDRFGQLIPKAGTPERAKYDQWNFFSVSTLEPQATRLFACDFILEKNETTAQVRSTALSILKGLLQCLDGVLGEREYILGKEFSISDILLTTTLSIVYDCNVLGEFPKIKKYVDKNREREAFKVAYEKNGAI